MENAALVNLFTLVKYPESMVGLGANHIERARKLKGLGRFCRDLALSRFSTRQILSHESTFIFFKFNRSIIKSYL